MPSVTIDSRQCAYHAFEYVFLKVTKNTNKHNLKDRKTEARLSLSMMRDTK